MKKSEVKPGVAPAPGEGEFSLIPNSKLLHLYAAMLKCRMFADAIVSGTADRRKRSRFISEAVTVGVTIDLQASDAISPAPGDLTPCAVKIVAIEGGSLKTLLRWGANSFTRVPTVITRANIIPPAASSAARFEAALRLAAHFRSTNCGSVAVVFAGPEAALSKPAASPNVSRKQLDASLARAAAGRLPILFVRQSELSVDDLSPTSQRCGVPGIVVDRDDVVAVYRVASEALLHARRGNGPTLIDSKTWRLNGRGRTSSELQNSIGKMELYLAGKGLAYRSVKDRISREFAAEVGRTRNQFGGAEKAGMKRPGD